MTRTLDPSSPSAKCATLLAKWLLLKAQSACSISKDRQNISLRRRELSQSIKIHSHFLWAVGKSLSHASRVNKRGSKSFKLCCDGLIRSHQSVLAHVIAIFVRARCRHSSNLTHFRRIVNSKWPYLNIAERTQSLSGTSFDQRTKN